MISRVELNEEWSFDKLRYKLFIKFPINEQYIAVCPRNESTISTTRDILAFIDVD